MDTKPSLGLRPKDGFVSCVGIINRKKAVKILKLFEILPRGSLATNHNCARNNVLVLRVGFNTVVHGDNVENVQKLSFVFVNTLDLNVKHRSRVDFDSCENEKTKLIIIMIKKIIVKMKSNMKTFSSKLSFTKHFQFYDFL